MGSAMQNLAGAWLHSFEEDTRSEQVFRPDSYPFPPSRRPRTRLDFGTGQMTTATPGPDDKLQRSAVAVIPLGMQRYRLGDGREIDIVAADSAMLRVRMA